MADRHQACHSPNMTGIISMADLRNGAVAAAEFVYDHLARKLRMKTVSWPASTTANSSRSLDLLLLFDQGVFYEIDSKNQSCEKKVLHSAVSSMEVQADASFFLKTTLGSESVAGEGLTLDLWRGAVPETQGEPPDPELILGMRRDSINPGQDTWVLQQKIQDSIRTKEINK
ncbi:unnamed protein product [Lota lota]